MTMQCKKFESLASSYLDRELVDNEAADLHLHLLECSACRTYLSELEEMSLVLKRGSSPEIPVELRSYVITAVAKQALGETISSQNVVNWLLKFNPRPLSYAAGVVASTIMFAVLLAGLKPIPVTEARLERQTILPVITGTDAEYHAFNDMPPDTPTPINGHSYQLPRVLDNSALVSFSHITYQRANENGMAALVEVGADGSARLVDMLDEHSDPYVVEQLWWSLSSRTFQPAMVEGHAARTRIVLLVEKMDVGG
jgi:Putative zinc-finger